MLLAGFPSVTFGTNCYVIAPAAGEQCVVIDPGLEVERELDELLKEHRLQPVAVILTHGHLDHTFSVTPVCNAKDVPAYIHPGDRELLVDPMKGLSYESRSFFGGRLTWTEPSDVKPMHDGEVMQLAGLEISVDHAPGHTEGSVTFRLPRAGESEVMVSGDLLFQGSIGRTDLPGGDYGKMLDSLRRVVLPQPDETLVLPGHGGVTTIGHERLTNPFLQDLAPAAGPHRGL